MRAICLLLLANLYLKPVKTSVIYWAKPIFSSTQANQNSSIFHFENIKMSNYKIYIFIKQAQIEETFFFFSFSFLKYITNINLFTGL